MSRYSKQRIYYNLRKIDCRHFTKDRLLMVFSQFHPEDMDNGDGDAVMRMMVNMTKMKQAQREQNSSRMTCGLFE